MKKETQLSNEIKKLQYQLSYSEHINKEMAHYLSLLYEKTGLAPTKFKAAGDIPLINAQTHLQQLYYVEPLLMCYEENIHLLKTELDEMKEDAQAIQTHSQEIVKENTFLRQQLEVKINHISKCEQMGINVNFIKLDNQDLKEKLSLAEEKYNYLQRKNKELNQTLESNIKVNRELYDDEHIQRVLFNSKQQVKQLQMDNINLKNKIQILNNQLSNEQTLLTNSEQKIIDLQSQLLKVKNELKVQKQQLENNQTVQEGLQSNLQAELQTLKEQLKISINKEQQLFNKTMQVEAEINDKNNKIHNLSVQNAQLQSNNNNMLQMLQTYEVKVTGMSKKVKKLEGELKEGNEEKGEYGKKYEIMEWKLSQKEQELERKETEWKKERVRINKMWEERVENLKKTTNLTQP